MAVSEGGAGGVGQGSGPASGGPGAAPGVQVGAPGSVLQENVSVANHHASPSEPEKRDPAQELVEQITQGAKQRTKAEPAVLGGIQQRAELYELAFVQARQAAIDGVAKDAGPAERLAHQSDELRKVDVEILPPETIRKLAAVDARSYGKLHDSQRQAEAALAMAETARLSAGYRAALANKAPEVAGVVRITLHLIDKANQTNRDATANTEAAAPRAEAADDVSPSPTMTLDPVALERVTANRARDLKLAAVQLGLNGIEQAIETNQARRDTQSEEQRAVVKPAETQPEPRKTAPARAAGDNQVKSDEVFTALRDEVKPIVPAEVEGRYLRVGGKFYHPKNTEVVAFEDKGNKLETRSNSEQIAEAMVTIARARGWDEIKVSGSETFRKEVWLEAAAHGMQVKGYTPSAVDKAALAQRTNEIEANRVEPDGKLRERENGPAATERVQPAANAGPAGYLLNTYLGFGKGHHDEAHKTLDGAIAAFIKADSGAIPRLRHEGKTVLEYDPEDGQLSFANKYTKDAYFRIEQQLAQSQEPKAEPAAVDQEGRLHGRLVDHGKANYHFGKDEKPGYYVKLNTVEGEKTIWGKDLARSMSDKSFTAGDQISLKKEGEDVVKVNANVRDADGAVVGQKPIEARRNEWTVRAEAFAQKTPAEAVQDHPELAGAYAVMASIEKKVSVDNLNPQQRAVVTNRVKANLVNSIERGEVPHSKIREQVEGRRERTDEREVTR